MKRNLSLLSLAMLLLIASSLWLLMPRQVDAQDPGRDYANMAAQHLTSYLNRGSRMVDLNIYPWTWRQDQWDTPAMGCPDPNQTYPQVNTLGYEIVITVNEVDYLYYVSSDKKWLILCINNLPDPSSHIWKPTPTSAPSTATPPPTATLPPTLTPTPTVVPGYPEVMTDPNWEIQMTTINDVPMVLAPVGCFMMGSLDGDADEQPVHEVCFREPFWIDQTEVTRAMYEACLSDGVCTATLESDYSFDAAQPINRLTWFQARDYCEWRDARLPSEAEWEYAARGPQNLVYPWGNEFDGNKVVWAPNAQGLTANTASMPEGASWLGALHMSGNVWEWTNTIYLHSDFPYPYDATDGRENPSDEELYRVIRGGSFFIEEANYLRGSYRNIYDPTDGTDGSIGVRCARDFELSDLAE